VALSWDAANATWDRWVLAFGPDMQEDLLRGLGFRTPDLRTLALLAVAGAGASLLLVAWLAGRRGAVPQDPAARAYAALCARLARLVRARGASESPESYLRAVSSARPDLAADLHALTRQYLELRYAAGADAGRQREFARGVRRFRPPAVRAPASGGARPRRTG
jgi:hypothetical protein